ncbi:NusA-like transcription termination signal-binding factor [Methanococcoides orientis]|uniref:NusA-like transcription termination signal-binding factor n=1 Tax=Methanococcoides orientis TaxID=2822137 RepID=UPI001E2EE3DF|nr:NusA-like transcription termination signal-binding factor [Methanococcoides orientis]UGV39884.1 NusA-like transcription termination signal-binding factor [Methanococcoides orientis]
MSEIRLSTECVRYIALFESMTDASIKDCIIDDGRVIYVVNTGDMGAAIGKRGDNINRVKRSVDKHIELIEYSDEPVTFIKNAFGTVSIKSVKISSKGDKKIAYVDVSASEKGLAIGRNGSNIEKVKMVVSRHHDIDDVILE